MIRYPSIGVYIFLFFGFCSNSAAQLCVLNDDFNTSPLDSSWIHHQSEYYDFEVVNGHLVMDIDDATCNNNCPWYHSQSAGFIYKNISGNFEITSVVQAEEASGPNTGNDISNDTQLGGLMVRNGNTASENYVFNVVGTRFDIPSIETKSTTNDNSGTIEHFGISNTRAELKMTREGPKFTMYSRDIGASTWILRSTFMRPDFPDTLQVGVIAYAFESYPEDLLVKFDFVHFSELIKENEWLGGNGMWNDPNMWSLNEIPDSSHHVIIDNPQSQVIQILPSENFKCFNLEIRDALTQLEIDGNLTIHTKAIGCD